MRNVAKIYFLQKYVNLFINKKLGRGLFAVFFFFIFQHSSVGYAMQNTEESEGQHSISHSVVKNKGKDLNTLSHEDEELIPLLPVRKEKNKNWKQSWFVKNVIVEFPIIGDLFRYNLSVSETMQKAGKSTSMLLGGSVGMMLDFIPVPTGNNMVASLTRSSVNMAIGMWVAVATYNTVVSLCDIVYQSPYKSSQDIPTL
ncbi:MAG: hypothetical protein K2P93_07615 [Alphaproteobacteria bacterium]|nr:hypothetical protein [Alphaproteobacteria bacterium]